MASTAHVAMARIAQVFALSPTHFPPHFTRLSGTSFRGGKRSAASYGLGMFLIQDEGLNTESGGGQADKLP